MPANPTCFPLAGACDTIRFRLATVLPGTYSALCFIHAVPAGFTLADVPGTQQPFAGNYGDSVIVCDPQCAFFNEPNENLLNRLGWARWMQPLSSNVCQPYPYPLQPQWEVFSLSCALTEPCASFEENP